MKNCGFTLAEVLITLMIIGIIAALTIPSVLANVKQQEFKTGLKKAVSVLNEAIQLNIVKDGETPYENGDLFAYLQRHMSVIKTGQSTNCYDSSGQHVHLEENQNCTSSIGWFYTNKMFYTTDGFRFEVPEGIANRLYLHETGVNINKNYNYNYVERGGCGSYGLANNPNNTNNPPCLVVVDVNGDRKPNPPVPILELIPINKYFPANDTTVFMGYEQGNQPFGYTYPSITDKKLQDVFTILVTDREAIPFGVVAQRAMYSK